MLTKLMSCGQLQENPNLDDAVANSKQDAVDGTNEGPDVGPICTNAQPENVLRSRSDYVGSTLLP